MNCLRDSNSIFSRILRRYYHHHQTSPRRRLIDLCSSLREFITHPRVRSPSSTVSPPLHLQYGTPSRRRFVLRWYHEPWKVAAATAITMAATVMAFCSRYDREIVPCTYRSHLVIYSDQELIDLGDTVFAEDIAGDPNYVILDPSDPRSVRVRHIAKKIIHAAYRGLGIYDKNDAPMLRATEKKRGKEQPHTSHLPQLNWEVILIEDDYPNAGVLPNGKFIINTGLFDWYKTDEEIAAVIAHEVSHIIARHSADINSIHGVVHDIFSHRREMEADYIGILLLGAAGFHPQWFHVMIEKAEKFERRPLCRPSPKKRLQFLSEAKTMNEALELYREVTAMDKVTGWYFQ